MRAIQITQFGKPEDVLRVVDLPEPPAPGAGEVKVAVEFSPLNLHDLLVVRGALFQPPLPLVLGNEGVARIVEVGEGVVKSLFRLSDRPGVYLTVPAE